MPFKGKPSINKRNREMALRERQKDKAARREQRSTKPVQAAPEPVLDPNTQLPLSADEIEYREFQRALKERAESDAALHDALANRR